LSEHITVQINITVHIHRFTHWSQRQARARMELTACRLGSNILHLYPQALAVSGEICSVRAHVELTVPLKQSQCGYDMEFTSRSFAPTLPLWFTALLTS